MPCGRSQIGWPTRRPSCRRLRAGSRGFTRPGHGGCDVLFVDSEPGKLGPHFIGTALLERTQDNALPIRADVAVLGPGETSDHRLGEGDLIWFLTVFFASMNL
jgi:hypothetical protein